MATILNDNELKKLISSVIINGDVSSIRPNSYILRLGGVGEFLNVGKEFKLGGKGKKGIKIPPGHAVALTAFEEIDFSREVVRKIYPDHDLHAFISPTTDLSREGLVAPTTQIDVGYTGTLNWTVTNTSNEERRFVLGERIFRLTILKLGPGETPLTPYSGDYQGQTGYVRSRRKGAPVGMRSEEWEDPVTETSPEALLDNLMKSGYPWHALAQRLKILDQELKIVSDEYAHIDDSINKLTKEMDVLTAQHKQSTTSLSEAIRRVLLEEASSLQNRWLISVASMLFLVLGLCVTITGNDVAFNFLKQSGTWIGLLMILVGVIVMTVVTIRRK